MKIKNKKVKNTAKTILRAMLCIMLCISLCVLFSFQSFVFAAGDPKSYTPKFNESYKNHIAVANIDSEMVKTLGKTSPYLDELLDAYVKLSLYDLNREQAITAMLRKLLTDYPELLPYLGNSLLKAFDEFGGYYPKTDEYGVYSPTSYIGYGIIFDGRKMLDGIKYYTVIDQVMPDSPASRAGLKRGDEVIKIENINVEGLGMNAVSNLMRVYENKINLTVKRSGKDITVSMTKERIFIPAVSFYPDEKSKTAMIKIDDFMDDYMVYDLYVIFDYLDQNNYKNIIIDLRDNRGGAIDYMLETLNLFIPEKDVVLYSEMYKNGNTESAKSSGDGLEFDKICVLTNGNSASASEAFAISLRELTGAVVIGEKTYGKGVGQFTGELTNGDEVAMTGFEMLSPKGNKFHKNGVEPDIKISPLYADMENKTFNQLNFVNCLNIKKGADNQAVLALNQRLARIGYISPGDITSQCTDKTVTAVEIFQRYNKLPVGISKIDYMFLDYLNYYLSYSPGRYEKSDVQYECAKIYIEKGKQSAKDYAAKSAVKPAA